MRAPTGCGFRSRVAAARTGLPPGRVSPGAMDGADRFMAYAVALLFAALALGFVLALVAG